VPGSQDNSAVLKKIAGEQHNHDHATITSRLAVLPATADLQTQTLGFKGFDSRICLSLMGAIPRSMGSLLDVVSQRSSVCGFFVREVTVVCIDGASRLRDPFLSDVVDGTQPD
jgi:hypothetical protein